MTVPEVVRTRLLALAGVTALVSTRVFVGTFPQDFKATGIRVQRIDEFETVHLRGTGSPIKARVQIDSVAPTLAAAYSIDAALHGDGAGSALAGFTGTVGGTFVQAILPANVTEEFEPDELKRYRVMRDYFVWTDVEH